MSVMKNKAKRNVNVSRKNSDGSVDTLKKAPISDIAEKDRFSLNGGKTVGCSLGITKNMDNYESLRVDVWLSDTYEIEDEAQTKFKQIRDVLSDVLEETVKDYI